MLARWEMQGEDETLVIGRKHAEGGSPVHPRPSVVSAPTTYTTTKAAGGSRSHGAMAYSCAPTGTGRSTTMK